MFYLRRLAKTGVLVQNASKKISVQSTISYSQNKTFELYIPPSFKDVILPENRKLPQLETTPDKSEDLLKKMPRRKDYMRGPETIHNDFIYKQYGIIALTGAELHIGHINMLRNIVNKYIDTNRMFAIWRIPPPWKAISRRPKGKRAGGGKGSISFYATPVKAGRVILEIGGKCEYEEVKFFLENLAKKLPCYAMATSYDELQALKEEFMAKQLANINPITKERVGQLKMGNSNNLMSRQDKLWNFNFEYS